MEIRALEYDPAGKPSLECNPDLARVLAVIEMQLKVIQQVATQLVFLPANSGIDPMEIR